jgi:hypothetical protein
MTAFTVVISGFRILPAATIFATGTDTTIAEKTPTRFKHFA